MFVVVFTFSFHGCGYIWPSPLFRPLWFSTCNIAGIASRGGGVGWKGRGRVVMGGVGAKGREGGAFGCVGARVGRGGCRAGGWGGDGGGVVLVEVGCGGVVWVWLGGCVGWGWLWRGVVVVEG